MKNAWKITLAAFLVATLVGTAAWLSGFTRAIWPSHPQTATFLVTLLAAIFIQQLLSVQPELPAMELGSERRSGTRS